MKSEQISKRLSNQNAILRTLHYEGELQRGRLSQLCGIRKSSITSIISDLVELGIVYETQPGRYRSAVAIDCTHHYALAASITPHEISFARVSLCGELSEQSAIAYNHTLSPKSILETIATELKNRVQEKPSAVIGIGVAIPGIVDPTTGICLQAVNLNQWQNIQVGEMLTQKVGSEVIADNDVRCQLQSVTWFKRLGRHAENILYIFVDDGVSCALTSHGELIIGARFSAGEIGHTKAGNEKRPCLCGREDCLETYCSLPAILAEINSIFPEKVLKSATDIANLATNTPAIDNILDRIATRLARSLSGIVAATDPATLILGTTDQAFSECLRPHLRRHLYNEMIGIQSADAKITTAGNAKEETLRGIGARVIQNAYRQKLFRHSDSES